MRKSVKVFLCIIGGLLILGIFGILTLNLMTLGINLDENKLINMERLITYYDINGNEIEEQSGGHSVTDINDILEHTKNAFIAIEDKRFYTHTGVDTKGLFRALFNNIKSFSFKEGASTITQQLVKNTHLSSEKTLTRKLAEVKLSKQLEKRYSKDEILEKYLNTIYFGNGCYGITDASLYYFSKSPENLDINESAMLAAIIKAPSNYSPYKNFDKCFNRKNLVLKEMLSQKYISEVEYNNYTKTMPELKEGANSATQNYVSFAKNQISDILDKFAYSSKNFKVYTYLDPVLQKGVDEAFAKYNTETEKSIILADKNSKIKAYRSTCGDINRQLGSVIKPLLVYAPAIENNVVDSCSLINDEKVEIGGYSPSNYNDVYYGRVSVKQSLVKSLNTCAVKILNYTGVENSKKYLEKMGINFCESDTGLCLALGAMEKGAKLSQITAAYSVFNNEGYYQTPTCIKQITTDLGNVVYRDNALKQKIFGDDTAEIVTDMLRECALIGTSKNIKQDAHNVCAKTGTAGTKNGNTDAYNISFNPDYILGVWFGNKVSSLMPNTISGGTYPTLTANSVWNEIFSNKEYVEGNFNKSQNVETVKLDKISYDNDGVIEKADELTPARYIREEKFKKNHLPKEKSTRFSVPIVENPKISYNNNRILLQLCQTQYCDYRIIKEYNGIKETIYDSKSYPDTKALVDVKLMPNTLYTYSILPYRLVNNEYIFGNEVVVKKIKTQKKFITDSWWID